MKAKRQILVCGILLLLMLSPVSVRADSIEQCKAEVRRAPDSVEAICNLANAYTDAYIQTGKKKQAIIALKVALEARKLNRDSALPHLAMARVYQAQGKKSKATERALWAAKIEPEHPEVKKMREQFDISDHDIEFFFAFDEYEGFNEPEQKLKFEWGNWREIFEVYKVPVLIAGSVLLLLLLGGIFFVLKIIKLVFCILFFPFKLLFGFGKKKKKE